MIVEQQWNVVEIAGGVCEIDTSCKVDAKQNLDNIQLV